MDRQAHQAKLRPELADSYQITRALADKQFNEYKIWNAAYAIQWTIKTGRISALKERQYNELSGQEAFDLIYDIAEQSQEITLAAASKTFIEMIS